MKGRVKIKIVGGGLAGCSCARILCDRIDDCQIDIYEKGMIGGLCRDVGMEFDGELYQLFGPHIFHTSNPKIIGFVLRFADFKPFCNRPIAYTDKGLARLPFSIETMKDLKGERLDDKTTFDEKLLFDNCIKDYSFKQWESEPKKDVIERLKIYQGLGGSYFNDLFEGLPICGFTSMMKGMIDDERISVVYRKGKEDKEDYDFVIWTAPIDEIKGFKPKINWRGSKFDYVKTDIFAPRLTPVYNICSMKYEMTRSTDMDQLTGGDTGYILNEIPGEYGKHYPIVENREDVDEWIKEKEKDGLYCCGRLGTASYFDMDDTIENAFEVCKRILGRIEE